MSLYGVDMDVAVVTPAIRLRTDVFDELVTERNLGKQEKQAEALGVTPRTIQRLRKGRQPSLTTAMRIAEVLGVPFGVLFERIEDAA